MGQHLGWTALGTLFSSFDIATSGMQAAQLQLDVTGHNISNVNREGFSRQRVNLGTRVPIFLQQGQVGRGVAVKDIERLRDTFLDDAFRRQNPNLGFSEVSARFFSQIEQIFQEPGPSGTGVRINSFFDALNDFANNVESIPARQAALSEAGALADTLNLVSRRVNDLRSNANAEVFDAVSQINSIGDQISRLNAQIRVLERGGDRQASDLRDDRDLLIDQLSRLVDITYRERTNGEVDIQMAGEEFVSGDFFQRLETVRDPSLDAKRPDLFRVQFVASGRTLTPANGELAAAIDMRDRVLVDVDNQMDELAATLIQEVNRIQTQGNGLVNLTNPVRSTNLTVDGTTPLVSADLPFDLDVPGSFDVVVYDAAGVPTVSTINVTNTTTLDGLAAQLSGVANINATVINDRSLEIDVDAGFSFGFANDTAGVLTALGINGLFTGSNAGDISVNADLQARPELLTSGFSLDPLETGDNTAALALAALRDAPIFSDGEATINEFFEQFVTRIGVDGRTNLDRLRVDESFVDDFQRGRQEVSGVNLDEEVTNLLMFQRAFEASARVITVTDRMLETLLNTAR